MPGRTPGKIFESLNPGEILESIPGGINIGNLGGFLNESRIIKKAMDKLLKEPREFQKNPERIPREL